MRSGKVQNRGYAASGIERSRMQGRGEEIMRPRSLHAKSAGRWLLYHRHFSCRGRSDEQNYDVFHLLIFPLSMELY